jgi:hypothetical protein
LVSALGTPAPRAKNGVVLRKRDAPTGGSDEDDIDEDDA